MLRDLVSKGPDLELDYDSAYSTWPGQVRFRGLSLEAQDYNIQFAIRVETGEVDISLHELMVQRFRALSLRADGLSFRLRHKVHEVGDDAARLAAYPPIGDYPSPPLYEGPKPPKVTDADYDLWEIALENIDAELAELWILEHRYVGSGAVRGGFHLRPARWFEVYPATVRLERGALMFGAQTFASGLFLDIGARIERTDVTKETGLGILRSVTSKVSLDTRDVDASVAQAYLPEGMRVAGWGRALGTASMTSGVLDPGSSVELTACPLRFSRESRALEGGVTASFRVASPGKVEARVSSPALALSAPGHRAASAAEPKFEVDFSIGDVTEPFRLERVEASLPELSVPSIGLVTALVARSGVPTTLGGRLDADGHVVWRPQTALAGRAQARLVGGVIELGAQRATFGARAEVELAPSSADTAKATTRGTATIELDDVRLREGDRQSPPFRAAARTQSLTLGLVPEPRVSATWQISADPADALLSVVLGAPVLEELAATVLGLEHLRAKTKLTASRRQTRLELVRGESGALAGSGYWQRPASGKASGAFLLTTNVANLGLAIDGGELETDMFVADDWLDKRRAKQPKSAERRTQK